MYQKIKVPSVGQKITVRPDFSLDVPDTPIIPYIEGDGTGVDITPVMIKVVDAAVAKAYGGKRKIAWMEVYAGEKANAVYGDGTWLPAETLAAFFSRTAAHFSAAEISRSTARALAARARFGWLLIAPPTLRSSSGQNSASTYLRCYSPKCLRGSGKA